MNTTINRQELAKEIHANAVAKGFWDEQLSDRHFLMLAITELSEAVEAHRKERWANREAYQQRMSSNLDNLDKRQGFEMYIKDTVEDELADAYIRLLDLVAAREGWLQGNYIDEALAWATDNKKLPVGTFTEQVYNIVVCMSCAEVVVESALTLIEYVAHHNDIDLFWHIREKMKYNASRPRLHGKKY